MNGYTVAWLLWGSMFLAIEGKAILNKTPGDTLSEHVWSWFSIKDKALGWKQRRAVLTAFLAWLTAHLLGIG